MDLNFLQGSGMQKLTDLEKNLQNFKETLKSSSVSFGSRLLNDSKKEETRVLLTDELIKNWNTNLDARKNKTDIIIKIKNIIERKEQLERLCSETKKIISTQIKEIDSLKKDFSFQSYKNHKEDFADEIAQIPELETLEAKIQEEKAKIADRDSESKERSIFEKFMPTVKNLFSKTKLSSNEKKIKKLIYENSSQLFSDEDFENMGELLDELPEDLSTIISNINEAKRLKRSSEAKLEEIKSDIASSEQILSDMDALKNHKQEINKIMKEIEQLDGKIETSALLASNFCVDLFFDANGKEIKRPDNEYADQIKSIATLRKKCFETAISIDIVKRNAEISNLEKKIQDNIDKINKDKKQIQNLYDDIAQAENINSDMQLFIKDLEAEIKDLEEKISSQGV